MQRENEASRGRRFAGTILLLALALLSLVMVASCNRGARTASRGGEQAMAPEFSLSDLQGKELKLSAYHGKVVLLDFWATWCTPCRTEIPEFVRLQQQYGPKGLQVIGISLDDDASPVRNFYRDFHMNYPVAVGDAKIAELFGGVFGLPVSFLIGRDGRIYTKHVGETPVATIEREIQALLESGK